MQGGDMRYGMGGHGGHQAPKSPPPPHWALWGGHRDGDSTGAAGQTVTRTDGRRFRPGGVTAAAGR